MVLIILRMHKQMLATRQFSTIVTEVNNRNMDNVAPKIRKYRVIKGYGNVHPVLIALSFFRFYFSNCVMLARQIARKTKVLVVATFSSTQINDGPPHRLVKYKTTVISDSVETHK